MQEKLLEVLVEDKKPIIELLEECDYSVWQEREKYWISQFPNLINLTKGGDGCLGFIQDESTKENIQKSLNRI